MKVTPSDLATMRDLIAPLDNDANRAVYRSGQYPRADVTRDVDKRYRWDLFHAACGWKVACHLYDAGCNDAHIDTALRSIVAPLGVTA